MDEQPENSNPPVDPVQALSQIEDDVTTIHEAQMWAAAELVDGRSPEELTAQLTGEGWDADEAEQIVETARKETREERGVVTRDDVVRDLNVDYRRATGGLSVAFRSGLFGLYGFTTGFLAALRSVRKLKRVLQRDRVDSSGQTKE
jgi:hypothetical protein